MSADDIDLKITMRRTYYKTIQDSWKIRKVQEDHKKNIDIHIEKDRKLNTKITKKGIVN